jgi:hypothetical protein
MKLVCYSFLLFWGIVIAGCGEKTEIDDNVEPLKLNKQPLKFHCNINPHMLVAGYGGDC